MCEALGENGCANVGEDGVLEVLLKGGASQIYVVKGSGIAGNAVD